MRAEYEALGRNIDYYVEQNEIQRKLNKELKNEIDTLLNQNVIFAAQNLKF